MNQKTAVPARSISPLVVSEGFVQGWAYDPLRPVLAVTLSVDGIEAVKGLTGHPVADNFYATAAPPNIHAGFCLPLPRLALDGRVHKLVVKVSDWQALPSAPHADVQWYMGPCFGEVKPDKKGFFEGWVGFRKPLPAGKIPPVVVSQDANARFAITLTFEPSRSVDGSQTLASFRVAQSQFAGISNPVFTCLGRELQVRNPPVKYKTIGKVEHLDHEGIRGWIFNAANPAESLDVVLVIDDQPQLVARPNVLRPGIAREIKLLPEEIGICGFNISLPRILKDGRPHTVSVRCKADGTLLNTTPLTYQHITPGMSLDQARALIQKPVPAPGTATSTSEADLTSSSSRRKPGSRPGAVQQDASVDAMSTEEENLTSPSSRRKPGSRLDAVQQDTSIDATNTGKENPASPSSRRKPGSRLDAVQPGDGNAAQAKSPAGTDKKPKPRSSGKVRKDSRSQVLRSPSVRSRSAPGTGRIPVTAGKKNSRRAPQVTAVILNRNGAACLDNLFRSLLQHNSVPLELIVIDHASVDDSLARIRHWQDHLSIRVEALDDNYSFSASCNRGARLATTPYVLFLNNDIVWLQDALPGMLDSLEAPDTGIVGLKLLKTEFEQGEKSMAFQANPVVQHLGVRFTLIDCQYYPYEENADTARPETRYTPQHLPVVTGAVMLCRREQFLAAGGFDEGYVYGYEDVEFCLRLTQNHGLRSICRNDLVALHHHGYTRLTGREPGMINHQVNNQVRLGEQLGLWIKHHWWQSLLDGDQLLTTESLTIGFAIGPCLKPDTGNGQLAAALELADALVDLYPHCRTIFLNADSNWDHVGDCHVLVALSPEYDLRVMQQARADLRTALYVYEPDMAQRWSGNPGLALFDLCLYRNTAQVKGAVQELASTLPLAAVSRAAPLGDLLASDRLRVLVRTATVPHSLRHAVAMPARQFPAGQQKAAAEPTAKGDFADQLLHALKLQGAIVSVEPTGKAGSDDSRRVADVVITLFERAVVDRDSGFHYERQPDVVNVLWIIDAAEELRARDIERADQVWLGTGPLPPALAKTARKQRIMRPEPKALKGLLRQLLNSVDDRIGRTFYTP